MKKPKTIFDILEYEQQMNNKSLFSQSSYFSNFEEDHTEEAKDSNVGSSFNYFKDSRVSMEEYFNEESDLDDRSSFVSKNESVKLNTNQTSKELDYIKILRLGCGSYGQVFKVKHKETNKIFAIKEINKAKLIKENKYYQAIIENEMLKECNHPNIVKYYGFYETEENFNIIEEYCPYGDLASFIYENKQNLSILEIQYIIGQIIICLEYLSTKNIIHRDIKPENFLLTDNFNLKLIDFGTSTFIGKIFDTKTNNFIEDNCKGPKRPSDSFICSHQLNTEQQPVSNNTPYSSFKYKISDIFQMLTNPFSSSTEGNSSKFEDIKKQKFVGTAEYMAPEIINSKKIGYYTDMWSLICILYLCFTGETPFSDKTEYLIFQKITRVNYNLEKLNLIPEEALDLLKNFFKAEPSERLGYKGEKEFDFNKIKSHPFFILKEEKEEDISKENNNNYYSYIYNIEKVKQNLMFKCSYFRKFLEKKNKNYKDNLSNVQSLSKISDMNSDYFNKENNENEKDKEINNDNNKNGKIIKSGLLKKKSPYFYYDIRKVILYDTPRIEYIDPDKLILKGTINLNKKCSAQLIKSNQFELITPQRTFIFMCKDRYDISPWVSAINNAIDKFSK